MRRLLPFLLLFPLIPGALAAPDPRTQAVKIWVTLRDKGPVLSKPGIQPRKVEDAPVYAPYLEGLRGAGFAVSVALKWQNRVSGWADTAAFAALRALPYVTGLQEMPRKGPVTSLPNPGPALPKTSANPLSKTSVDRFFDFKQVFDSVGATALADTMAARGLSRGKGVRIAVIDEDFHLGHSMFDSLFANGAIVDQWDFVTNSSQSAFATTQDGSHGAWVLGLIGGNMPGRAIGLAPHAKFLLYRSENRPTESYVEEDYLAAALERAVDSGAQVINASLGYRYDFDNEGQIPYKSMNGRTRPASIAALGAARRGVLVVVSMGNENGSRPDSGGGPYTPTLTSPADADSILAVGIEQAGLRCSYASTGPTFDGRLKPELTSTGLGSECKVYLANTNTEAEIESAPGTSFAAPVVAGVAALLRQMYPDSIASAQKIRQALMVTARRSDSANNQVGNGLMRAVQADCALRLDSLVQTPCGVPLPSLSAKGVISWRGGNANTLTWPGPLDLSRIRMWDLKGRPFRLNGSLNEEGDIVLESSRRLAPGAYILRIPKVPDVTTP